ncbi:hypothetical protein [Polyangium sp. y55x31]|uniref:hypothetical protein n=1 Tax=Polyangium sp. y55x31 TaxID=3042688 RepID=UPI0024822065|nr:hypothetical protein [Polyangium sp. y55x31]MDI1475925.1 hypothetical protein [Polyangium sp. y55x31]
MESGKTDACACPPISPCCLLDAPAWSGFSGLGLSERDRRILELTRGKLVHASVDFGEAVRALGEAVEEVIPAGHTYVLGQSASGPIIGSLVSGVGIVPGDTGILVVRVDREGLRTTLGRLVP